MSSELKRLELRERAVVLERDIGEPVDLAVLWRELADGRAQIVDSFAAERCYVVVRQASPGDTRTPLGERQRRVLEALLCGADNKIVAYDLEVAPSTVSQTARQALQQIGSDCTPGRACPLLSLAAQAASQRCRCVGRGASFVYGGVTYRVVGATRPDDSLAEILPPAEYAVVRRLLEGQPYEEIARSRGTSTRTVANQLSAVFRRVGVSGRGSLLRHLITSEPRREGARDEEPRAPAPPRSTAELPPPTDSQML